jgi:hypothetical protein
VVRRREPPTRIHPCDHVVDLNGELCGVGRVMSANESFRRNAEDVLLSALFKEE